MKSSHEMEQWTAAKDAGDGFHGGYAAVLPAGSRRAAAAHRVLSGQAGAGVERMQGLRNALHCATPHLLIPGRRAGDRSPRYGWVRAVDVTGGHEENSGSDKRDVRTGALTGWITWFLEIEIGQGQRQSYWSVDCHNMRHSHRH